MQVSHVHRLRNTDRIFFVSVNLRRGVEAFRESEYLLLVDALEGARQRLAFLLAGYVLMPDYSHGLIWIGYPLSISQVIHDIKKVSARRLHERRESRVRCGSTSSGTASWVTRKSSTSA